MATKLKRVGVQRLSRADQKIRRTESMLDAAWVMFCEKGYEASTMEEVAESAGVSRYPVYYAFGDKQNLFLELWKKKVGEVFERVEPRIKRGGPLRLNLMALAQILAEDHQTVPYAPVDSLFFVVHSISLGRPDIAEKLNLVSASGVEYFAGIVESSSLGAGEKLAGPARNIAAHLLAMTSGLSVLRFQTHQLNVDAKHILKVFLTIALDTAKT
ncbi:TetR/AcrR family transcriptional regulator [Solimonas terrae]|uniref:TetR/AcrR family transcriptional regulator n=1 Tax=Solimonas terrae TaxID=1396819 RepID=A0A6M2BNH2_9GAMM|nr:TetR/AcrR family transcriptional regulator [Solimonas terrae]NGY04156.1 TetR/AcrR family transcriptional regulator [Solimonas terrae]